MGLDSVELVIAFEEAFGVAIEDAAAEKMLTPKDVIDYIEQRRGIGTRKLCLSRRAFHKVRERLMEIGIARSAIRLGTPLSQIFVEENRRVLWMRARGQLPINQWPDLVLPPPLRKARTIALLFSSSAAFISTLFVAQKNRLSLSLLLAMFAALCAAVLLDQITLNARRCFPGIVTIRDLAMCVTAGGPSSLRLKVDLGRKDEEFTREEIAGKVRAIVIEQLGISEAQYGEEKEFVRDLGMN
jgi:acyl carrier protein